MQTANFKTYALVLGVIFLSSCATILSSGKKSIYISSNIQGAKVFDDKNQLIGNTPMRYYPINESVKKIIIEKEGYASQTVDIVFSENKNYAFIDAMLFCIPCVVDYPTKNIYTFNKDSIQVKLKRVYKSDVQKINLIIEDAKWDIKDGIVIGNERKEPIYFKKSHFDSYLYKDAFCKAAVENRFNVLNCGRGNDFKYVGKSNSFNVQVNFKTLKISKIYKNSEWHNTISFNADVVFLKSGKAIKTLPVDLSQTQINAENKPFIANMLYDVIVDVFNDDKFYDDLINIKQDTTSSSERIEIDFIKQPTFAKNKDLFKHLMKGVVTIEHDKGHGSGFIISQDGYIITNYHVIKDKQMVNIKFNESITLSADVIRGDKEYDVALLKLSGNGFTALPIIHSDSISSGEDVFAIGTPEDISLGQSVTKGIVSGKRKFEDKIYIQTDVTINSGNSGGPLLNEFGQVVGMVTMKLVGDGVEGLGFCVPSNQIMEVLNITYK